MESLCLPKEQWFHGGDVGRQDTDCRVRSVLGNDSKVHGLTAGKWGQPSQELQ